MVARVGRPRAGRGLAQQRGIQSLARQRPAWPTERNQEKKPGCSRHWPHQRIRVRQKRNGDPSDRLRHFKVTRYAVRLWISESRHFGSMSICHCNGLVTTTFGIESCLAKLRYVPSGSLRATTKAEM